MKSPHACFVFLVAVAVSVPALASEADPIQVLARESGLSERKVAMILGNRSAYAEYRASYNRSLEDFVKAIGQQNYQRLLSGQPIEIKRHDVDKASLAKADKDD